MNSLLAKSQSLFKRHGSTILTCMGGIGVIMTSIAVAKATPKALKVIEEIEQEKLEDLTNLEKVKVAGPSYIPAALIGLGTITCIFGANMLNRHQQAALISAYAFLDNSYKEYRNKVEELYGEGANAQVVEEIAKDKYEEDDFEFDDGELFYDTFSRRYFESTSEDVLRAEYEFNKSLALNGGAYLNDFYDLLGIQRIDAGDTLGWSQSVLSSIYWDYWLDFDHDKVVMDDGLECTIITFRHEPVVDFHYY